MSEHGDETVIGYVPSDPSERCHGGLHYTSLGDNNAFEALLARHGLEYVGELHYDSSEYPSAVPFRWARPDDTLQLSTRANPLTGDYRPDARSPSGEGVPPGYLSYVRVDGEYAFSRPLWEDIVNSCTHNKGVFRPLAPTSIDDIPSGNWPEEDE